MQGLVCIGLPFFLGPRDMGNAGVPTNRKSNVFDFRDKQVENEMETMVL